MPLNNPSEQPPFLRDQEAIKAWLTLHCKIASESYYIDSAGRVHVAGDVRFKNSSAMEWLEVEFGVVKGCFDCSGKPLKSLKGAPIKVDGYFSCSNCAVLRTLDGAPLQVGGAFYCDGCAALETCGEKPIHYRSPFVCNNNPKLKDIPPGYEGYTLQALNCPALVLPDSHTAHTLIVSAEDVHILENVCTHPPEQLCLVTNAEIETWPTPSWSLLERLCLAKTYVEWQSPIPPPPWVSILQHGRTQDLLETLALLKNFAAPNKTVSTTIVNPLPVPEL